MADQNNEYSQYAPQTGGRLFSNAWMGFNKEEVLEYLEEITEENYQRQEAAERRIQELTGKIDALTAGGQLFGEGDPQQLQNLTAQVAAAQEAAQKAEEAAQGYSQQLYSLQQENAWLQQEYQKSQEAAGQLSQQLVQATNGQWAGDEGQVYQLQQQLAEAQQHIEYLQGQPGQAADAQGEGLQAQLAEAQQHIEYLQNQLEQTAQNANWGDATGEITQLQHQLNEADLDITELQNQLQQADDDVAALQRQLDEALAAQQYAAQPYIELETAQQQAAALLAQANTEANQVRDEIAAEKERMHSQIRNSASGLMSSIGSLRGEITDVESNVGKALENMQNTLSEIITALARTEQNLGTFGVQVERFPTPAPAVTKAQSQPLYIYQNPARAASPEEEPAVHTQLAAQQPAAATLRKVTPGKSGAAKPFRPTYSTSPTAGAPYWPQAAQAYDAEVVESREARLRNLSESLVDTLRQMMDD